MPPHNGVVEQVSARLALLGAGGARVVDADVHLSDPAALPPEMSGRMASDANYFHGRPISAEDALTEMAMAQVDMALVWQNPSATPYCDDQAINADRLRAANLYVADAATHYPDRFIPAGWTDPKALGIKRSTDLVSHLVKDLGFVIVKMNPAQNAYPITSADVLETVAQIVDLGAVPAFHFGADTPYTPPEGLADIARRHPDVPIIAVHMGGGGAGYVEAERHYATIRRIGLAQPNLFFVLSAKRDTHIESDLISYQLAGPPFSLNIACASDAPYGRMTWNFGGYRAMFAALMDGARHTDPRLRARPDAFRPFDCANYLGGNITRLVAQASKDWLSRYAQRVSVPVPS